MVLKEDQERVQLLLKDTITLLCKNGLSFKSEFSVEALIGITLDKEEVFLVNINESIKTENERLSENENLRHSEAAAKMSVLAVKEEDNLKKRHRKRHRARSQMSDDDTTTENIWSQSDVSSLAVSELDDSNTHNVEPPTKRSQIKNDDKDVVVVKTEVGNAWGDAAQRVEIAQNDFTGYSNVPANLPDQAAFAGMRSASAEGSAALWTPAAQLLHMQEHLSSRGVKTTTVATIDVPSEGTSHQEEEEEDDDEEDEECEEDEGGKPLQVHTDDADVLSFLYKEVLCRPRGGSAMEPATSPIPMDPGDQGDQPYKCDVCGNRYMKRDGLVRHWKVHDTSLHRCKSCTLFFQTDDQLQQHIISRHGPMSLKHPCVVCGKRFDRPFKLQKHMATHTIVTDLG